jgi:3-oxocholest-4-en-26-oyl-CoA dehydrogenase beta subunit
MDFSFDDTQLAISRLAGTIFKDRSATAWDELARADLLGTAVPVEYGGAGHGLLELCVLLVEAGAAVSADGLWSTLVLAALPLAEFGTREQKQQWLPQVAAGRVRLSAALDRNSTVRARQVGRGWALTGSVRCVPAVDRAARVLVPAEVGGGRVGLFWVAPAGAGVIAAVHGVGPAGPEGSLALSDAPLGQADLLGDLGDARFVLPWLRQRAVTGLCAVQLGVCQQALRMTAQYAAERKQFDRPIATFQAVGQRLADAYIDVEAIRLATWDAAWRISQSRPAEAAVAVAKYWAAEAGHRVISTAHHVHGGIGVVLDYPLARYYQLGKAIELALGSGAEHLDQLGELIAGG